MMADASRLVAALDGKARRNPIVPERDFGRTRLLCLGALDGPARHRAARLNALRRLRAIHSVRAIRDGVAANRRRRS